jgi:hypothetical protein
MELARPLLACTALVLGACAAPGPAPASNNYWRHQAGDRVDFAADNQTCASRASRVAPGGRADSRQGGATIPQNRIDRPPEKWVSAVAERAYMDCMRDLGWSTVAR